MKPTTRVRIDTFQSSGEHCRIVGRKDHIISSEQYISRDVRIITMSQEEPHDDDWYLPGGWEQIEGPRRGHNPVVFLDDAGAPPPMKPFEFSFVPFALNKTIEKCNFKPLTSQNYVDTIPEEQVALLPYLCENAAISNYASVSKRTGEIHPYDTNIFGSRQPEVAPAHVYEYEPAQQGQFFITIHTDQEAALLANCVERTESIAEGTRFVDPDEVGAVPDDADYYTAPK